MADKRVTLGVGSFKLALLRATEVTEEEEIDSEIVKTFDEPVSAPSSEGGFKIDVSMIETRSVDDFITLKRILKAMKTEDGSFSIFEDHKHREGNFTAERHYTGVKVSSDKVTTNAEDLTARDLSFIANTKTEIVNGEEI